ncbi:MAG TPA: toxin-antitoxin system YwqK family antitoxin [Rhabdochlamydiaceae bacterium]|jgi:antitoxin component YwqK of YwqJK toxin-antitoxin module
MTKLFIAIATLCCAFFLISATTPLVVPVTSQLKTRQPHWSPKIAESYPDGQTKRVLFYEQIGEENEAPVKQVHFYPNGQIQAELDLISVPEDSPGAKEWKSTIVPHGMCVSFYSTGQLERIAYYDRGLPHGEVKKFFAGGKLQSHSYFKQGERHGPCLSYYEDGSKAEEMNFDEGKVVGEMTKYFAKGNRALLVPYENGVPHGNALEWYESGALKASLRYQNGLLHSDGKNPAAVTYAEDRSIQEVKDFSLGQPIGTHLKYHPNGKEQHKIHYKNGKKQGKEQLFSAEGKLLGEGEYNEDMPTGKHWRTAENGHLIYLAHFDKAGNSTEPITEYNEQGQKIAEYHLLNKQRHLKYCTWYADGKPQLDYNYKEGSFEGEQREYYPSGQLKVLAFYNANHLKDRLFEEWYENGQKMTYIELKDGVRDGLLQQWYDNGVLKSEEHYVEGKIHETKKEWHFNGAAKYLGAFNLGKKQGTHREWNGAKDLLIEVHYDDDLPIKVAKAWYSKNKPKQIVHFADGKRNGKDEEFYENGQLKSVSTFKEDLHDGEVKTWYDNGSICTIKHFRNGIPVEEHKEYYDPQSVENKKSLQVMRYFKYTSEGKLDGEQKTYYPNGAVHTCVYYKNGELHGMKAMWDAEGNLLEEAWYENGKLSGRFFEKMRDGKEQVFHYKNNRREGMHEIYYPSQESFTRVKGLEVNFVNDLAEGDAIEYNEEGIKSAVTPYVKGKKEGVAKVYSPKGTLMMSISFKEDKRHGPSVQYYPDGKVHTECDFADDLKEGEEKSYFHSGKLAKIIPYKSGQIHGLYKQWNENNILVFEGEYNEGKRHGKFHKFYEDGKPLLLQSFADDQLHGVKKKYDASGVVTETKFDMGKKI